MFLDALTVAPNLALACASALEIQVDAPGTGLKTLRTLSQGVRMAVHEAGAVQGYTLVLGDKAQQHDTKLVQFLKSCRLLRLSITVPPLAASEGEHAQSR